jgi:ATP-dependent RNA helicase DDX21
LKDIVDKGRLDLTKVKHVILDEVDRMLDMGFIDDVEEILGHIFTSSKYHLINKKYSVQFGLI